MPNRHEKLVPQIPGFRNHELNKSIFFINYSASEKAKTYIKTNIPILYKTNIGTHMMCYNRVYHTSNM